MGRKKGSKNKKEVIEKKDNRNSVNEFCKKCINDCKQFGFVTVVQCLKYRKKTND